MEDKPLVTSIDPQTLTPQHSAVNHPSPPSKNGFFVLYIFIVIFGLVAGYFLAKPQAADKAASQTGNTVSTTPNASGIIGSSDTSTFKDTATGTLQAGGIRGEGTHKLVRDGGPSQTVYLVSSVVDLDSYVGKKVQVWGQTLQAKYAGWLMDVGRLKILD